MTMTRKQFLRTIVGAGIGVAGVAALASCGGDDGGTPDAPGGTCTTPSTAISSNHGHVMMVALADVTAGVDKTYDISGTAGHMHSVTVTAANMASLKTGGTVMVTSTTGNGHTHAVTVMCA